jgi:ATP/maltotriose-dependent transcriptional regulator MalT/DNA-binding SARP family transcriptional activator
VRGAPTSVLRTLLLPPRLPARCLPRTTLVDRLRAASEDPLALVVAGAGYGKTTLLAQAREADPRPWIWVSCDDRIDGHGSLLAHVTAAFQRRYPGVGAGLVFAGAPAHDAVALADELAATVPDDVVVAVDDVHLVPDGARECLLRLAADLPPHVHLVLAARSALAFPSARLRARHLVELGEEALALAPDEGAELLAMLDPSVDAHAARELCDRAEGWISALILAAGSRRRDRPELPGARGDSFDYLAEEVFAGRPEPVRAFLLDSSVLERFTPDVAAAVTGRSDARDIVADLLRAHLFTVPLDADGEWYRYHHLFRTYLRRTAAGTDPAPLHRRAAAAFADIGEPALAVHHHLAAGDRDAAATALEPIADALVRGPTAEQVAAWLDAVGPDVWSHRPALVLAHASLRFTRSDLAADTAPLAEATEELLAVGEHERAAVAYFRLVQALIWSGGAREPSIALGERLLPRLPPDTATLPAAEIMLAAVHAQVGRYDDAERGLAAALGRPGTRRHPAFAAYAAINRAYFLDHRRGHVDTAAHDLDTAIATLEAGEDDVLAYRSWAYSYRGVLLGGLGRWSEALHVVHRFPEAAVQQGFGRLAEHVATYHGLIHLAGLQRWDELEAALQRARPLAALHPGTTYAVRYRTAAAQLAAHRGDRAEVARAIADVRATPLAAFPRAMLLADLADVARRSGQAASSAELADEARASAGAAEAPWPRVRACLLGAAARGEDDVRSDELLAEALALTEAWGYEEMWSRRERALAADLLVRALVRGLGPPGVAARLAVACGDEVARATAERLTGAPPSVRRALVDAARAADVVDPALLARFRDDPDPEVRCRAEDAHATLAARPRPTVRVVTLGAFGLHRRGTSLPALCFGRRKARALLAALLAGDGPVHRDVLVEWLWPDLAPARAVAALHTTLHALRQDLQAGLGPAGADLVVVDGEHYRLVLGPDDVWDAAEFLAAARAVDDPGPGRLERAAVAEARYAGPFLPPWPYESWAHQHRERVERAYRRVLEVAAEDLTRAGRPLAAVRRYELLLAREPEREGWHRGLIRAFAHAGERGLALRQYHACRVLLRDALGVDPSTQTQDLYRSLL